MLEKVNAVVSGYLRTVDELRKKWSTYASNTKIENFDGKLEKPLKADEDWLLSI